MTRTLMLAPYTLVTRAKGDPTFTWFDLRKRDTLLARQGRAREDLEVGEKLGSSRHLRLGAYCSGRR